MNLIPIVAIVGRPNVGKSTIFNRIARGRKAVVHDEAGVTRDRNSARAEWEGRSFWVVDTGGVTLGKGGPLAQEIQEQVDAAIEEADLILFVLDAETGVTTLDEATIRLLSKTQKPVLCAANKADDLATIGEVRGLHAGGLGEVFPISARKGNGLDDLFDRLIQLLPSPDDGSEWPNESEQVRVAIVGRPNVGKSSLVNALLGTKKMIVSDIPGTTRDAVDTPLTFEGREVLLIDTAGLRRKAKTTALIDIWSSLRSMRALERCDVAVLVLDATAGILDQDVWIAAEAIRQGKAVVIVVNKWDALEKDGDTARHFEDRYAWHFKFLPDAPLMYTSAKTGRRVEKILGEAIRLAAVRCKRVSTSQLNEVLREVVDGNPPPANRNSRETRIYYGTQVGVAPPTFALFTNHPESLEGHYERYLANQFKDRLQLAGSPVRILIRKRERPPDGGSGAG